MGISVFFGWEETFDGDDYLVYGLDKEWLLRHPEVRGFNRREQWEQVRQGGGCVVQAHPFRDRDYIPAIHLSPLYTDAVEVGNAGNYQEHDVQAWHWARKNGLYTTAGSDIHSAGQYDDEQLMGVWLPQKLHTVQDFVEAILSRTEHRLRIPTGRLDGPLTAPQKAVWEHGKTTRRVREAGELFNGDMELILI